ncbi:MAG: hypothetical protein ACLTU1_16895 [Blautia wexlerae]
MFHFVKKKNDKITPITTDHGPLKLPEVPDGQMTITDISDLLNKGIPIWAWYNITKKYNGYALASVTGNYLDGYVMWRKEGDYLCKYIAYFDADLVMRLKLHEVCMMANSNVLELISTELKAACSVMYDDIEFSKNTLAFVHDITEDMILEQLQTKKKWIIEEEHFCKKVDTR